VSAEATRAARIPPAVRNWDDEADLKGYEYPDEDEADPIDDETVPCPHRREPVHVDAERCPGRGR
jgi:hypothetical protein